jgi:hypothetical protein
VQAEDGSCLFFLQDKDGDEEEHLFMVEVASIAGARASKGSASQPAALIDLTPFEGADVSRIFTNQRHPTVVYFDMNKVGRRVFQMFFKKFQTLGPRY